MDRQTSEGCKDCDVHMLFTTDLILLFQCWCRVFFVASATEARVQVITEVYWVYKFLSEAGKFQDQMQHRNHRNAQNGLKSQKNAENLDYFFVASSVFPCFWTICHLSLNTSLSYIISKETCVAMKWLATLIHDLPLMLLQFLVCLLVPLFW